MVLANQPVVLGVGPYPKPNEAIGLFHRESTIMTTDSCRPVAANLFEMQGWVLGIVF